MGFWSHSSPPPPRHSKSKSKPISESKKSVPRPAPPKHAPLRPRPGRLIVHFVRHAEAKNNLRTSTSGNLIDPPLTPSGKDQCHTLRTQLSHLHPTHILCSPLRRTLQTAVLSLGKRAKITALPDLRECGSVPNCTGTSIRGLKRKYEGTGVDFAKVGRGWEFNRERDGAYRAGKWRRSREQRERGERVKREIWGLGTQGKREKERLRGGRNVEVLVFSHREFLHGLTGDHWHNADIISLTMVKTSWGFGFTDPPSRYAYHW